MTRGAGASTYAIGTHPYDGWTKIGAATNVKRAVKTWQPGNPRKLVIRSVWPGDLKTELELAFWDWHAGNGWYALPFGWAETMSDVAFVPSAHKRLEELVHTWTRPKILDAAGVEPGEPLPTLEKLARRFASQMSGKPLEFRDTMLASGITSLAERVIENSRTA
jgi:hypothetical protein